MPDTRTIEEIARSYLGTPFEHQGRTPGEQLDCAGTVICLARAKSYVEPDFDVTNYAQQPDKYSIVAACNEHLVRVGKSQMRSGLIAVMAWDNYPQHLGIVGTYAPDPRHFTLIHALRRPGERGQVIEERIDDARMRLIRHLYRFPEDV